jgi:DNA invertase Pin-like site-specific DNA recombinase
MVWTCVFRDQEMNLKRSILNCAIYTRKSSEEGLEQGFNSLDAQREACEAFVLSQQHEGWRALASQYDDGGYSGGTIERPALKKLLEDIDKKRIQVVVVYKVDRLTRSLADFAKIVELFDARGVSFVSVTQQFNTTSSMGRLTLNVLLSFAQFEREVTGERIRDKIAASKQKGMWMGGTPPIGYLGHERTLIIDDANTELIHTIYSRYLELGCVRRLKMELDAAGTFTPHRTAKSGRTHGGSCFSRGHLYRILSNRVYLGQIPHRDKVYPGQHPAIIDQDLWDSVQAKLIENRQGYQERCSTPSDSLLAGLLFDGQGHRLIPSHSQKKSKRYRYYISEPLVTSSREQAPDGVRLPAQELELLVISTLKDWLSDSNAVLESLRFNDPSAVHQILGQANRMAMEMNDTSGRRYEYVRSLIRRVIVESALVRIIVSPSKLLSNQQDLKSDSSIELTVPVQVRRCGLAMRLLVQGSQQIQRQSPDNGLINLVAKAHDWLGRLTSGRSKSIMEIAAEEKVTSSYVTRVIYRAFLAPDIVEAILAGTQPPSLTLDKLKHNIPLPIDWDEQRKLFGFKS